MKFLKVWKSDICNIFHNRVVAISVIAIVFVPLIYGGLYLAAFWDPYGKTENIPVAVVNEDKGGVMDDKDVNYGNDIVEKLKNNKDIKWQFVNNRKEAEKSLKSEKGCYAMMVIPEDFSQKIVGVDKGKLDKPKLILVANEKKNYVIGLITDKAGKTIKQDVDNSVMDNFTIQVYDSLYKLRDGMESAANGTSQIKDGVADLKDNVPTLSDGIGKLYDGSSSLSDKLKDAGDGSNKLRDNLGTLNGKMPDLVDGVSKLHKASSSLEKKIGDASDGSKKLRDGVLALNDQLPDLGDGVNDLYDGSSSLKEGLGELDDKMPDLIDGVGKLKDGAKDLKNGIATARDGMNSLDGGVQQLQDGASTMQSQLRDKIVPVLQPNLPTLIGVAQQISKGAYQLNSGIPSAAPIKSNAEEVEKISEKLLSALNGLSDGISNNDTSKIDSNLLTLGQLLNGDSPSFQNPQLSKAEQDLDVIGQAVPTAKGTTDQLKAGIANLDSELSPAKDVLKLFQGTGALKDGASKVKTDGAQALYEGLSTLYDGSDKLYSGIDSLYDKSEDLRDGVDKLYSGSQNLNDGVDKFKGTVPVLTNGVGTLSDGTRDLSDGLFKLNEGSKTLEEKMGELDQKVPDLQDGVQQLYDGSTDLSDGLIKLSDGSIKLRDGLKTLKDKIPDMQDGINKLYESVAQLNDSFIDGAKELSDKLIPSSKAMGKYMSDPVKLKDNPLYEVSKYGEGMAPYFISLALWVGALMLPFIITDEVADSRLKVGPQSVILGKYLTYAIIGTLQAIVISFVVMKIGLKPSNVPVYYMFNIFLSLVFFAIIENLIFFFGNPGRLAVVIILLLQLTSSNGTFPGELLPKFFKTIGPFLPFTYSISALREIDSGIDWPVLNKDIVILAAIMVAFIILSVVLSGPIDNIKSKMQKKDLEIKAKEIEKGDKVQSVS